MRAVLFVNPRSGAGELPVDELTSAARELGVQVRLLDGKDLAELATSADADVLGVAGGDGTLGAGAAVAIERGLPFVCIPWGTRNHFAADVGIDTADPIGALRAFVDGEERRVDVGRVADRVFLNNVSLGLYARLVYRRERRRRRGEMLARLRALLVSLRDHRRTEQFVVDGTPVRASVLLVANNAYRLDLFSLGARERLNEGVLAVYAARGLRRLRWTEQKTSRTRIEARSHHVAAAIDGEPVFLTSPLELRVDPGALVLLVPPDDDRAQDGPARPLEGEE